VSDHAVIMTRSSAKKTLNTRYISYSLTTYNRRRVIRYFPIGVNPAGVTGPDPPPIFDLDGSISVLDPAIIPTQSCVLCTVFGYYWERNNKC